MTGILAGTNMSGAFVSLVLPPSLSLLVSRTLGCFYVQSFLVRLEFTAADPLRTPSLCTSGDLKTPGKSIASGTLYGVLTMFVTYIIMIFVLGSSIQRHELRSNYLVRDMYCFSRLH